MPEESGEAFIAVRAREEVGGGADELVRRFAGGLPAEEAGALAAYRWALDPAGPAPVTGRVLDAVPTDLDLAVEERAAIKAARDRARPLDERARAVGAARAPGWILGFAPVSG
ncbi:hypothetical protein [Kitasatospora sp. NPDC056181]|uniref:hypothetical protein n=1 Tax=Kitasatospora sp. NPDC056181 TaxID=3345737 RepID=UPI0035E1117F